MDVHHIPRQNSALVIGISADWTYDASLNAVIFNEGHIPVEGQTIDIEYAVWGCGE